MDATLMVNLARGALGVLAAIRQWQATASPEQVKAFVDGIHADGGTVDLAAVDGVIADVRSAHEALGDKIAQRGG